MKRFLFLLPLTIGSTALAQISIQPPTPTETTAPAPTVVEKPPITQPATSQAPLTTMPSAESVLQELLRQQNATQPAARSSTNPASPGTTNTGLAGGGGAGGAAATFEMDGNLIRENQQITQRTGHLAKDSTGRVVFIFDPAKLELPSMAVIPSRRLAALEDATESGSKTIRFTIDAKVTEYRGQNYLYIQPTGGPPPAAAPAASAPATAPATAPAAIPNALVQQTEAVAPNEPVLTRLREGDRIISRLGRYVKDDKTGNPLFVFDSDGKQMADPPMGLLNCKSLETMEQLTNNAATAGNAVQFIVSGEVTQYRGKNFLWVQNVRAVKDLHEGIGR